MERALLVVVVEDGRTTNAELIEIDEIAATVARESFMVLQLERVWNMGSSEVILGYRVSFEDGVVMNERCCAFQLSLWMAKTVLLGCRRTDHRLVFVMWF